MSADNINPDETLAASGRHQPLFLYEAYVLETFVREADVISEANIESKKDKLPDGTDKAASALAEGLVYISNKVSEHMCNSNKHDIKAGAHSGLNTVMTLGEAIKYHNKYFTYGDNSRGLGIFPRPVVDVSTNEGTPIIANENIEAAMKMCPLPYRKIYVLSCQKRSEVKHDGLIGGMCFYDKETAYAAKTEHTISLQLFFANIRQRIERSPRNKFLITGDLSDNYSDKDEAVFTKTADALRKTLLDKYREYCDSRPAIVRGWDTLIGLYVSRDITEVQSIETDKSYLAILSDTYYKARLLALDMPTEEFHKLFLFILERDVYAKPARADFKFYTSAITLAIRRGSALTYVPSANNDILKELMGVLEEWSAMKMESQIREASKLSSVEQDILEDPNATASDLAHLCKRRKAEWHDVEAQFKYCDKLRDNLRDQYVIDANKIINALKSHPATCNDKMFIKFISDLEQSCRCRQFKTPADLPATLKDRLDELRLSSKFSNRIIKCAEQLQFTEGRLDEVSRCRQKLFTGLQDYKQLNDTLECRYVAKRTGAEVRQACSDEKTCAPNPSLGRND